jgi:glycosyltransferase involved in cell wall biosynthesis
MTGPLLLHAVKVAGISGAENHLLAVLPRLRAAGYDVRLAMLHEGEPGAREFADRLETSGIPVDDVRLSRDLSPGAFRRLLAVIRRHRPALLHTHLVHADFYGLPAGALARVPVRVSTKHGFNPFRARAGFGLADRSMARLAALNIAISHGLAGYLARTEGFDERSFEIVHYGIDGGSDPPPPPERPRIACVGRLVPIKGHETLLRAVAVAMKAVPGLELQIAGDGPLEAEIRVLVGSLGLSDAVRFLGRVSPPQPVYEQAAIVVVPSLGEGFGMVALEAMERGRAVVASDVGGLPEIVVANETGLLVPPGDAEALAAAVVELASDTSRVAAFGLAGRARALSQFTQERCTQRLVGLYRDALSRAAVE